MATQRARHIQLASYADGERLKQLLDDGADFVELAATFSQCSTATQGGELGCFPATFLPRVIADALADAEVGKLIGPIASPWGYHLLQVTERNAP